MSFNAKVKRRKWTKEEKHNTLKSCASRCACCGTKLTMKTLTMEHVVPISKGGENELNNLVVLCQPCNSRKGDKFCWPAGYYMAMPEGAKLSLVERYTRNWVKENITLDYIKEFPMIAETLSTVVKVDSKLKMSRVVPLQCVYDIFEVTYDTAGSIQKSLNLKMSDFTDTLINEDGMFSLVAVRGRISDKIVAIYTMQYVEYNGREGSIVISEVYSSSKRAGILVPITVLNYLMDVYKEQGIYNVLIRNKDVSITEFIMEAFHTGNMMTTVEGTFQSGVNVNYPDFDRWFNIDGQFLYCIKDTVVSAIEEAKQKLMK